MKSESKCEKCGQPLEEWEAGVCEGCGISGGWVRVPSGESRSENGSFTFAYWVAGFLVWSNHELV